MPPTAPTATATQGGAAGRTRPSRLLTGSAVFLSYEAINRLINPQPIQEGTAGIAVMILSIC